MSKSRFSTDALFVVALAVLASVSGAQRPAARPRTPPPSARGGFELVSCSLGCVATPDGFTCSETQVFVNEELRFTFSDAIDPASISNNTFRLIDVTGRVPAGALAIDPADPNTLLFRPELTFDSAGNPIFGLAEDRVYLLHIPGTEQDIGPYLRSVDGTPNRVRLLCTLIANLGVLDAVPGRPRVKITVQAVLERDPVTGEPLRTGSVPAEGATDVLRSSTIDLGFDDLMNPATLVNPVTGTSSFVRVFFDPDGNVFDRRDQVALPGRFLIALDQHRLTTLVRFVADGGLPASGTQRHPGRVVIEVSPQVQDLAANSLANPGLTAFTTEAR